MEKVSFNKMVKRICDIISFEEAWDDFHLYHLFKHTSETMKEVKAIFDESRGTSTWVKKMTKLEDPGKFVIPCTISRVKFSDSLCNTWSTISLMSKDIAERLDLATEALKLTMTFVSFSTRSLKFIVNILEVRVENCIVSIDFQVLEMGTSGSNIPLIQGRAFLAIVVGVVDLSKGNFSVANIDKNVYYKVVRQEKGMHLASCIVVSDFPLLVAVPQEYVSD